MNPFQVYVRQTTRQFVENLNILNSGNELPNKFVSNESISSLLPTVNDLVVWFQNARAKWRRLAMKQDGGSSKSGDKSCGENSNSGLDLDSYTLDSPEDSHYLSSPLECSS
ncbi:hypothetical protein WDU94_001788 [Cyamophila willieti]